MKDAPGMDQVTHISEHQIAVMRIGGDLQLTIINRMENDNTVTIVQAFDSDGNPLARMGVFAREATAIAMLPSIIDIARDAYGRTRIRGEEDFDLVAWKVRTNDKPLGWEWVGSIDESLHLDEPYYQPQRPQPYQQGKTR